MLDASARARLVYARVAATERCWLDLGTHPHAVRRPQWPADAIARLLEYLETLLVWRRRTSLVATAEPIEVVHRHLADSLALAPFVPSNTIVADLGSGAGLPGVPLAIACTDSEVLLIEPRRKRVNFLQEVVRVAAVDNASVVPRRWQALAADQRGECEVIVARAFGPLSELLEATTLPTPSRYGRGRRIIVMKGPAGTAEAESVSGRWGVPPIARYHLPGRDERVLLLYGPGFAGTKDHS